MSNEELAVLVKSGDTEAAAELWESCRKLIHSLAYRYYITHTAENSGVELDDLEQEGYFIVLDAVKAYDPAKEYRFNTYLSYHAWNRFNEMCGLRGNRKREPLNDAVQLDDPLGEEEDSATRLDLLDDPDAERQIDDIAENDEREWIARTVQGSMARLPEAQRAVIRLKYYGGATYGDIAERIGETPERARGLHGHALATLGRDKRIRDAAERMGIIERYAYAGSLGRFRETLTSSVEAAVLELEKYGLL